MATTTATARATSCGAGRTARSRRWLIDGSGLTAQGSYGPVPLDWSIVDTHGDYNGDGKSDLLWRHTDGTVSTWLMDGATRLDFGRAHADDGELDAAQRPRRLQRRRQERPAVARPERRSPQLADRRRAPHRSKAPTIRCRSTGASSMRTATITAMARATSCGATRTARSRRGSMDGSAPGSTRRAPRRCRSSWTLIDGHGDYNGDGKSDILWRGPNGEVATWLIDGSTLIVAELTYGTCRSTGASPKNPVRR